MARKSKKLKLFVWKDVLCDYYCGVMFALAPDVETARRLTLESMGYESDTALEDLQSEPAVYETEFGFYVYGGS